MSLPLVNVTCIAVDQNGTPVASAIVKAKLTKAEIYGGFVVPASVTTTADATGTAVLQLWPNALGANGSMYQVTVTRPGTGELILSKTVSVPNSACNLHQILTEEPYPPIDAAQQALAAAQGALALVTTQATNAAASASASAGSATAAANSATGAASSATSAASSASTATAQASASDSSATAAAASAAAALASKNASATNEANAANSATSASTSATNAASSATAAASSATSASTSAATATTQATGAATSASTATAQASNAATSATSAANSATGAAGNVAATATNAAAAASSASTATTASASAVAASDAAIAAWGSATAPAESLAAISQSVHSGAVVASFLYDTNKDSDGGQWRKRCTDKSWYTETIQTGKWLGQKATAAAAWATAGAVAGDYFQNTTDKKFYTLGASSPTVAEVFRGNAREFPALALIVAESARVAIYDASAPGCPMWMVFVAANGRAVYSGGGVTAITCIAAGNGQVVVGVSTASGGLGHIDFGNDSTFLRISSTTEYNRCTVANRNVSVSDYVSGTTVGIVNRGINAVAMTVLPDAPIDPLTGLAVPTIAVATGGGVSVIKHDGSVVNSAATTDRMYGASIDSKGRLWAVGWDSGNICEYPPVGTLSASFSAIKQYSTQSVPATIVGMGPTVKTVGQRYGAAASFPVGMMLFRDNPAAPTKGMVSYITKDYATGWMVGDIKRSWLADTVAETVVGSGELVTNGTFTTDTSGWTAGNSPTVSVSAGSVSITNNGATNGIIYQAIPTIVGKTYRVSADIVFGGGYARVETSVAVPTSVGGAAINVNASGAYSFSFVAAATTTYIVAGNRNDSGATNAFDNISCKLAEPDRSVKAKPITVVGTLTKTSVAAGAALVAYSGFSASNYLEEAYSADLDFGTGDYCVMGWVNPSSLAGLGYLFGRQNSDATGSRIYAYVAATTGVVNVAVTDGTGTINLSAGALVVNAWALVAVIRSGNTCYLYINGIQVASAASPSLTMANATALLRLGVNHTASYPFVGSMALWRIGATAPSADQIAYIYRTEKPLFAAGAQCTLAGSSNAVTALTYDEETDTWHAGTSWGRTGFRDLLRVDSEVTTVGAVTSISAGQGAVLVGGASSGKLYQPAFLLRDEIRRRAEARRALGKEPVFFDFDAVTSQTAFTVQQGYTVKAVYSAGTLKRQGSTKDYTVSTDGFRETVTFGTAPGNTVWVSVMCVRA